jgi:hypothetical protein
MSRIRDTAATIHKTAVERTRQMYVFFPRKEYVRSTTSDVDPHWFQCRFGPESVSSISGQCGSGFMALITKKFTSEIKILVFFFFKNCRFFLSLGLHEGHPSYKRSLLSPKENIQHFENMCLDLFYFCGPLLPFWIRIQPTKINADSCGSRFGSTTLIQTFPCPNAASYTGS